VTAPLEKLAGRLRDETGISIDGSRLGSLEAALARLRPPMDAAAFLLARGEEIGPELLDRLIDEVTVNETFFFRQREELDAIDWPLLLEGARSAGSDSVRVWVAACASGEEAYTLAMLAADAFGSDDPPVSIVATDISGAALERGRRGQYRGRTVRTLDARMRSRHFVDAGDCLQVRPHLRRLIEFKRHNLIHEGPPRYADKGFDLIACRNVLIYFDGETVEHAIDSLERELAPGGMLVLGAADRLCGFARRLARPQPGVDAQRTLTGPVKETMRRPLGRDHEEAPSDLATALAAANAGSLDTAVEITSRLLRDDVLNADAYFVRGMAELGLGDTGAAVSSLRRALYVDPTFGLAAFKLGRAHEQRGDDAAAARAYEQALHTIEAGDTRHEAILDQVDLGDVAGACALRLAHLRGGRV